MGRQCPRVPGSPSYTQRSDGQETSGPARPQSDGHQLQQPRPDTEARNPRPQDKVPPCSSKTVSRVKILNLCVKRHH